MTAPKIYAIARYVVDDPSICPDVVTADNITEVLAFAVRTLQSRGVALYMAGEMILPGGQKLSGKESIE